MCGRFTIRRPLAEVAEEFSAQYSPGLFEPPKDPLNVSPGQSIPVVRLSRGNQGGHQRELAGCLWGLIPSWSKDGKVIPNTINARCETVATKPVFRSAYRSRRCLIPADGFYEPKGPKGEKGTKRQPFFIHWPDDRLFGIAGLWETWRDDAGHSIDSCTILTTSPNAVLLPLHERMPVILRPEDYDVWLDPKTPVEVVAGLMRPAPAEGMEAYEVERMGSLQTVKGGLFG